MTREDLAWFDYLDEERVAREAYEASLHQTLWIARGTFQEMGAKMRQVIYAERAYWLNHPEAA